MTPKTPTKKKTAPRPPKKKPAAKATGDCYEAAGKFIGEQMLMGEADRYILVHGEVRGQGPLMGVNFGHAWVIDTATDAVIDKSNGRDISLPRFIYYGIGGINDIDNYHEYTAAEARDKMIATGNYGPWDLVTSSGL